MQGYWEGLLRTGSGLTAQPYQSYNNYNRGQNMESASARIAPFTGDQNAAFDMLRGVASGQYTPDVSAGRQTAMDAAQGKLQNSYKGDNPYYRQMVQNTNEDTARAYQMGTSADLTRLMNMSGAFGGSAHQNAMAANEYALAKQLGNQTTSMNADQYNRSAQLNSEDLARQMQGAGLAENGQNLSLQAIQALLAGGNQQQQYGQQLYDQAYNNWANGNNWERNNVDWLANLFGRAQGSTGSSNTTSGYGPANLGSGLLGAGMLANGLGLFGGR